MNRDEAAVVMAFTGKAIGDFHYFHEYVERLMGRPVWTHEMGSEDFAADLSRRAKPDFVKMAELLMAGHDFTFGED